jgi:hypothetical protein
MYTARYRPGRVCHHAEVRYAETVQVGNNSRQDNRFSYRFRDWSVSFDAVLAGGRAMRRVLARLAVENDNPAAIRALQHMLVRLGRGRRARDWRRARTGTATPVRGRLRADATISVAHTRKLVQGNRNVDRNYQFFDVREVELPIEALIAWDRTVVRVLVRLAKNPEDHVRRFVERHLCRVFGRTPEVVSVLGRISPARIRTRGRTIGTHGGLLMIGRKNRQTMRTRIDVGTVDVGGLVAFFRQLRDPDVTKPGPSVPREPASAPKPAPPSLPERLSDRLPDSSRRDHRRLHYDDDIVVSPPLPPPHRSRPGPGTGRGGR